MPKLFRLFWTREFLEFLVMGAISLVANLGCGYALYSAALLPYTLCVFLGALSGLVVNFLLNYFFTFRYKGRSIFSQFQTFFVVAFVGTVLTALLARLFLAALHWGHVVALVVYGYRFSAELLAHAVAVALITFYSYLAHKFFSFNVGFRKRIQNGMEHFKAGR